MGAVLGLGAIAIGSYIYFPEIKDFSKGYLPENWFKALEDDHSSGGGGNNKINPSGGNKEDRNGPRTNDNHGTGNAFGLPEKPRRQRRTDAVGRPGHRNAKDHRPGRRQPRDTP